MINANNVTVVTLLACCKDGARSALFLISELRCSMYCFVSIMCCSTYCLFVLFNVFFCVNVYYCHRVSNQLQLNISYRIISYHTIKYHYHTISYIISYHITYHIKQTTGHIMQCTLIATVAIGPYLCVM